MDSDTHERERLPLLTLQCARVTESFIGGAFESDLLQDLPQLYLVFSYFPLNDVVF